MIKRKPAKLPSGTLMIMREYTLSYDESMLSKETKELFWDEIDNFTSYSLNKKDLCFVIDGPFTVKWLDVVITNFFIVFTPRGRRCVVELFDDEILK